MGKEVTRSVQTELEESLMRKSLNFMNRCFLHMNKIVLQTNGLTLDKGIKHYELMLGDFYK